MKMRSLPAALAAALLGLSALSVAAQDAAPAAPAAVTLSGEAVMPSLRDARLHDKFTIELTDSQVRSLFVLQCSAATSALGGLIQDNRECAITGNGFITNPRDASQRLARTQYTGTFEVAPDGTADLSRILVTYLPLGEVPASSGGVTGTVKLKPEHPSATGQRLKDAILKRLAAPPASAIDTRVDTVELLDVFIPSAGFPSDHGCTWRGSMAFAYQSKSWFMDLSATCEGHTYVLKGQMPWVEVPGVADRTQYNLVLTLPGAATTGDDALFVGPPGADPLAAAVVGISGSIAMDQSMYVLTQVDDKSERLPMHTKMSGTLRGQGVPLATVRSLSQLITLLARTFFGA